MRIHRAHPTCYALNPHPQKIENALTRDRVPNIFCSSLLMGLKVSTRLCQLSEFLQTVECLTAEDCTIQCRASAKNLSKAILPFSIPSVNHANVPIEINAENGAGRRGPHEKARTLN